MKQRIEGAFDEIYEKYAKMLYGYILQLCKNPTTADDILQTVFLKAIEHADSFEGKCEVSTWLCQIAKNTWLDICKRAEQKNVSMDHILEQQGEALLFGQIVQETDFVKELIQKEESTAIYREIHSLPEPYREVLMLRIMGCLSFKEIGDIFGKSETWGRVTFFRAKEKLKEQIGGEKK